MIKKIIFLIENRFSRRDYQRFGIELLGNNGFIVEVWELTPILHPEFFQRYTHPDLFNFDGLKVFNNRHDVCNELLSLSNSDFVISLIRYRWQTLCFYRALSKSCTNYSVSFTSPFPCFIIKKAWADIIVEKIKDIASLRFLETWKRLFMKLPLWCLGVRPAKLILVAGERYFNYRRRLRYPINRKTEILQIHALDYDLYLKEKANPGDSRPIAVFLDEFCPFHPDYIILKKKSPISADTYFKILNNFFENVEKNTRLEVVIAAHPRSDYENHTDFFKGRKCIRGETAKLIKESRLVLSHCSVALNLANLFYKPVIFMTCKDLDKSYEGYYIKEYAKSFDKTPIFIDEDHDSIDWKKELSLNKEYYDNYRKSYIKTESSDDLPFWQIVTDRLKKGFMNN